MVLFLAAYLGGILTIASPCILPVLPFVFARADRSFVRSGLPTLATMALTFALVAGLAAVAGSWAVEANRYGRFLAMALLTLFGLTLVFPSLSDRFTRPLVALGSALSAHIDRDATTGRAPILQSCVLGIAIGLLWAPCAGPVLGLILTGAALKGANVETSLLLFAYALGAATSLALALAAGGRVFAMMKRSLGVGEWIKRGLGIVVLLAVAAIGLGFDTGLLTRVSVAGTTSFEQTLLDKFRPDVHPASDTAGLKPASNSAGLPIEAAMPSLSGAIEWLNSPPLTTEALGGKVVLVDFWTYSCINCLRTIPYVRAWAEKYRDQGLVVIGVHTPEFAFEKNVGNVRQAVTDLKISYPVAIDNNQAIWRAFHNQYWPAHYFIDVHGNIRHHQFGESGKEQSERVIQRLLAEAGRTAPADTLVSVNGSGAEAAPDGRDIQSFETYLGYERTDDDFVSPGGAVENTQHLYSVGRLKLNEWGLSGEWTIGNEHAVLNQKGGRIVFRFHSRDLHLVLGPSAAGKPVRFRVTIDGKAPGSSHGTDIDAEGNGVVIGQRLYQLIRQGGPITDHTFQIEFLDPAVQAFAFTFG
jgi:cytochrome c biogenesis protein CcdA/thiol-disulfide isomerase/thioredoxin